jgi:polysaccharide biosynthesis transport protein
MADFKFKDLITPLIRCWWLLLIASALAGLTSYYYVMPLPPIYQSKTTLVVGSSIYQANPTYVSLDMGPRLAQAYAALAMGEVVANNVKTSLGLNALPKYSAEVAAGSSFIQITVTDTNPQRAQIITNEIARQLILQSPTNSENIDQNRAAFVEEQLNSIQQSITETQSSIAQLQTQLTSMESSTQIEDTQAQIAALNSKLNTLQTNYAAMLAGSQQQAINTLSIIEPANLPGSPIGPNKKLIVLVSALAGFILAAGAAYWVEYLDDTLKSEEDIIRLLQIPTLGYISNLPKKNPATHVLDMPQSGVSEAYRSLRTSLVFKTIESPVHTLLVSSPSMSEGKSTIVTNLAITMAQSGKKVIVVDADFRRPMIHQYLNIPNEKGLTDVIVGIVELKDALVSWNDGLFQVLPTGTLPPNPAELIGSMKMNQVLSDLSSMADLVVIDSAPFLVTDAMLLAAQVDGVLLVIRPKTTRKAAVNAMKKQLEGVGARILGLVLNGISSSSEYSNYYSGYYNNYNRNSTAKKKPIWSFLKFWRKNNRVPEDAVIEPSESKE